MNKIQKVTILILLMIILSSFVNSCLAFEIGPKELISLGDCGDYLIYQGKTVKTTYIVYNKDGVNYPAYCLNVDLPGAEKGSYLVNGMGKLQDIDSNLSGAWKAIINGYPYQSLEVLTASIAGREGITGNVTEQEAYTATKQAVYTMLDGRDSGLYGAVDSEAGRRTYQVYLNIINAARATSDMEMNLQVQIQPTSEQWQVDEMDPTCVSKIYTIASNISVGDCEIYTRGVVPNGTIVTDCQNNIKNTFQIGEQFKIKIPIQNLTQSENFTIEAKANLETKPVIFGGTTVPGNQNYALTGYMNETVDGNYIEGYAKNITKMIVVKKEYGTDKRLSGVKFHLLNENKDIVYENLETNEEGEIILENMLPGNYYLQETETLEGYNLYTDLIEIHLDWNEEFEVTVNNTTREITEVDKDFEKVEVTPHYNETVYHTEKETTVTNIDEEVVTDNQEIVKKLPKTGY